DRDRDARGVVFLSWDIVMFIGRRVHPGLVEYCPKAPMEGTMRPTGNEYGKEGCKQGCLPGCNIPARIVAAIPELYREDGVHLSDRGTEIFLTDLKKGLLEVVAR
ncbi:hypothetical protein JRQ81_018182, partial [Phrynocephalus forsythii]